MNKLAMLLLFSMVSGVWTSSLAATAPKTGGEVLYITPKYVLPLKITRPQGPFLLVLKNHSSIKGVVVHVQAVASSESTQSTQTDLANPVDLDSVSGSGNVLLDLPPGTYTIFDPGHPSVKVELIITN